MDIEVVKKLIRKYQLGHSGFVHQAKTAERYYQNDTDLLHEPDRKDRQRKEQEGETPLRNADNRIPFNFHGLLVNQKAAYMFTAPPLFDLGNKASNKALQAFLGDKYPKTCKDLCIAASNATVGWIHVWKKIDGTYNYAVVPSEQIIPVWSKSLEKELLAVFRMYSDIDEEIGDNYEVYEYWTDTECWAYRLRAGDEIENLMPYKMFLVDPGQCELSEQYRHEIGEVPFFAFSNNNIGTNDLKNIKPLIDTYCKIFSGFVNDLEDIQEVIFVLTNYGGADLNEFLSDLKYYKTIQIDSESGDDKSGVSTLTIDLPVEAREKLLDITRKCIFEQGMGIDPDPQNFGNSSGVALGFLYSLLELKAGLQETEFRPSFGRLIRCVCRLLHLAIKDDVVKQTWTRTSVKNDLELSQIAQQSQGIISKGTTVSHHPWVEDPEAEMAEIRKEEQEDLNKMNPYQQAFKQQNQNKDDPTQGDDISGKEE